MTSPHATTLACLAALPLDRAPLEDALALERAWEDAAPPPTPAQRVELDRLIARAAIAAASPEVALHHAQRAVATARDAALPDLYRLAQRSLAAAWLANLQIDKAFSLINAFFTRPLDLPPSAPFRHLARDRTAWHEVLLDMTVITSWAGHTSPELAGGTAALAVVCPDPVAAEALWSRLDSALERLLADLPEPEARRITEQVLYAFCADSPRASAQVLQALLDRYPDNAWALQKHRPLASVVRLERLERALATEPERAIQGLLLLADTLLEEDPRTEQDPVFRCHDLLINALLKRRDARAIDVQQRLYDAKRRAWGECPGAWLELQNLGCVYLELGHPDQARVALRAALDSFLVHTGIDLDDFEEEDDPHVAMILRNLSRLDQTS